MQQCRGQRTLGLRATHEAGQRAAERVLVELGRAASMTLQELRRGVAIVGLEGGVGPGAAEPLGYLEVTTVAGVVQRCPPIATGGVERGTRAVQPLSDAELAARAGLVQWCISTVVGDVERGVRAVQPLGDVEVILAAGVVQRCPTTAVHGVEGGACAVQPLGDVEVTAVAGVVKWLLTISILRPHARTVRHRCLHCRQITRLYGVKQPHVRAVTSARARCGSGRRLSSRRLCTCKAGAVSA